MARNAGALAVRGLAAALVLGTGAALFAQDSTEIKPEDLFASAKAAYGEKKYGKTLADLQLLVGAVSKLRIEQLKPLLPAAPEGWKAEDASGESIGGGMMFGAGLTLKRDYRKAAAAGAEDSGDSAHTSVELMVNSPLVGMIAPMLSNPSMLQGQEGMSVINVKGKKSLLEWHRDSKSGNLKILLGDNTTLLTIQGEGIQKADLSDIFAKAVDVEKLEKALAE
jgi:hypothetical protein